MKDQLTNFTWGLGVRVFRMTRKANLSTRLEPAFVKLAGLVPSSRHEVEAVLSTGGRFTMPPGYRDSRTVVTGLFQWDETQLLRQILRGGMTFLDVGAYVGYFTLVGSSLVGPSGHVHSFEPDSFAYGYLVRNIEANSSANVTAVNKAVSDVAGQAVLSRDPSGPESFIGNAPEGAGGYTVETVTLDSQFEALGWPRVDVVKMNIEGSEMAALKGMRELSARNPNLRLIVEFNPKAMARAGTRNDDFTATLKSLGFREGRVVERGSELIPNGGLVPTGDAVYNLLLSK